MYNVGLHVYCGRLHYDDLPVSSSASSDDGFNNKPSYGDTLKL